MTRIEAMTKLAAMIDRLRATDDHHDVTYDVALNVFANYSTPHAAVDELRRTLDVNTPRLDTDCRRYKNEDGLITVFVSDSYPPADLLANREGGAA